MMHRHFTLSTFIELIRKAEKMREDASKAFKKKQIKALEKNIEILYEIQSFYAKKAFFKGCELASSLLT